MRGQRGMSLIEVLVALVILGMVILSIAGLFTEAVTLNASGMDYTTVNNLARDRLEQLLARQFNDPAISYVGWIGGMGDVLVVDDSASLPPGSPFTRSYEVRELKFDKLETASSKWQDQLTTAVHPGEGNIKEITVIVGSNRPLLGVRAIRVVGFKSNGLL